jgi:hypothetical protein
MFTSARNRQFGLVGTLIFSALSLFALAFPLNSAKAQCVGVDLGFGCAGLGVGSWYTQPHYYGNPYPYYGYPYYGYPYYGYPAYGYPYYPYYLYNTW